MAAQKIRKTQDMAGKFYKFYARPILGTQTLLMQALSVCPNGTTLHIYEYEPNECLQPGKDPAECNSWSISPEIQKAILAAKWIPAANSVYHETCANIERLLNIPYLHIDSDAGTVDFAAIEASVRNPEEIVNRLKSLEKTIARRGKWIERTLLGSKTLEDIDLSKTSHGLMIRRNLLSDIVSKKLFSKEQLLALLYQIFARREREVLLYKRRKDVSVQRSYDEAVLGCLDDVLWIFKNSNPFENLKKFGTSSFKVNNVNPAEQW